MRASFFLVCSCVSSTTLVSESTCPARSAIFVCTYFFVAHAVDPPTVSIATRLAAKNLIVIDLLQQWATIDVIATCGLERPAALLETGDGPIGVARGHALHQIWWE
jgi:hypothetical protein